MTNESERFFVEGSQEERLKALFEAFEVAEQILEKEGREAAKELLPGIYDNFMALNKRDKERDSWTVLWIWNPEGAFSEPEFDALNLRRKKLSNAIGIKTASGEIRHDLNDV